MFGLETEIVALRLVMAAGLGSLLGLEREMHGRAAGLRTHLLVSMAACAFTLLSLYVATADPNHPESPGRIAAQIVTGIGFLGAGAIIKEGISVRGLTTAACLWVAAAIGMATGIGHYVCAALTAVLAALALLFVPLGEKLMRKHAYRTLEVTTGLDADPHQLVKTVQACGIDVLRCDIDRDYRLGEARTTLVLRLFSRGVTEEMAQSLFGAIEKQEISLRSMAWKMP